MISLDWFVCFLWWAQFIKFKLECMTSVWSQNNISFLKFQTITIFTIMRLIMIIYSIVEIFLSTIGRVVLTCFRILEYRCILFVRNKILSCHEEMRLNWQDWWSFFGNLDDDFTKTKLELLADSLWCISFCTTLIYGFQEAVSILGIFDLCLWLTKIYTNRCLIEAVTSIHIPYFLRWRATALGTD